jgi:hypothetical protein
MVLSGRYFSAMSFTVRSSFSMTNGKGLADVDPGVAKRTRAALAREIEGTDIPVAAGH